MCNVFFPVRLHSNVIDQRCSTQTDKAVDDSQCAGPFPDEQGNQGDELQETVEHVVPHGNNIATLSFLERRGVQTSNLVVLLATCPSSYKTLDRQKRTC